MEALQDPNWKAATDVEYGALMKNRTWHLVPPKWGQNIVDCKWVFKVKRKADGTLDKYKARLVSKVTNNATVLIMRTRSALLLKLQPSALPYQLLPHVAGLFVNLTSKMHSFMGYWKKMYTCDNHPAFRIKISHIMCAS
jgi:hypothetical protein